MDVGIEPQVARRALHDGDRAGLGGAAGGAVCVEPLHRGDDDARERAEQLAVLREPAAPARGPPPPSEPFGEINSGFIRSIREVTSQSEQVATARALTKEQQDGLIRHPLPRRRRRDRRRPRPLPQPAARRTGRAPCCARRRSQTSRSGRGGRRQADRTRTARVCPRLLRPRSERLSAPAPPAVASQRDGSRPPGCGLGRTAARLVDAADRP